MSPPFSSGTHGRLFLRSLDVDGKGYFSREAAIEGLRALIPVLEEASGTHRDPSSLKQCADQVLVYLMLASNHTHMMFLNGIGIVIL